MGAHAGAVAPLRDHPALDPGAQQALAKERTERYASCAELIEAARRALGLAAPSARRSRIPAVLGRRRRGILAAGLLVLAATTAAAIVAMTHGGPRPPPVGSGVLALDSADARLGSFTAARSAPSNIAVGEGAVWALNTEDETVSRIDPADQAGRQDVQDRRPAERSRGRRGSGLGRQRAAGDVRL